MLMVVDVILDFVEPNSAPGNTSFVAGFVQANVGDTSPNT
jgi:neutral ceramidase